jgi:hypothetical protein
LWNDISDYQRRDGQRSARVWHAAMRRRERLVTDFFVLFIVSEYFSDANEASLDFA